MVAHPPSTFILPPVATTFFRTSSLVSSASKIRAPHFGFSEKVVILSRVGGWGLSSENLVCLGTNTKNQISMRNKPGKNEMFRTVVNCKINIIFPFRFWSSKLPQAVGKNFELEGRLSLTLGHLCQPKSLGWSVSPPHLVEIVSHPTTGCPKKNY